MGTGCTDRADKFVFFAIKNPQAVFPEAGAVQIAVPAGVVGIRRIKIAGYLLHFFRLQIQAVKRRPPCVIAVNTIVHSVIQLAAIDTDQLNLSVPRFLRDRFDQLCFAAIDAAAVDAGLAALLPGSCFRTFHSVIDFGSVGQNA